MIQCIELAICHSLTLTYLEVNKSDLESGKCQEVLQPLCCHLPWETRYLWSGIKTLA